MSRLREARDLTQAELANALEKMGLRFHQQTIQRMEAGERSVRLNEACAIAKVLGVSVDSMTTISTSEREVRYAVDRLKSRAQRAAGDVRNTLDAFSRNVEDFATVLPAPGFRSNTPRPDLSGAHQLAASAENAIAMLLDAYESLLDVNNCDASQPNESSVPSTS